MKHETCQSFTYLNKVCHFHSHTTGKFTTLLNSTYDGESRRGIRCFEDGNEVAISASFTGQQIKCGSNQDRPFDEVERSSSAAGSPSVPETSTDSTMTLTDSSTPKSWNKLTSANVGGQAISTSATLFNPTDAATVETPTTGRTQAAEMTPGAMTTRQRFETKALLSSETAPILTFGTSNVASTEGTTSSTFGIVTLKSTETLSTLLTVFPQAQTCSQR